MDPLVRAIADVLAQRHADWQRLEDVRPLELMRIILEDAQTIAALLRRGPHCIVCGAPITATEFGPVGEGVCRYEEDPNAEDQGMHLAFGVNDW